MARAFITGARGFLGVELVKAARRAGHDVIETDVRGEPSLDLLDTDAVRAALSAAKPELLFHCAGLTRADPALLLRANVVATASLLSAMRDAAPKCRLVLVSSSAVYAPTSEKVTEAHPTRPVAPYGLSKLAQELLALHEGRSRTLTLSPRERGSPSTLPSPAPSSLDVVIARAFNLVGPGMPESLAAGAFARHVLNAEENHGPTEFSVGDTSAIRDFIDVRDVASGLLEVATHGRSGETYNLCRGIGAPVHDCLTALVKLGRMKVTPKVAPPGHNDNPSQVGDGSKLAALSPWRATIALETSMNDMMNALRMQQGETP
ncbi:MAG: NAD-dependent epimerase/dehydratase family protein [Archangium sp.]|nr:NAD-dependent epimerase/dehydratase family protein [Archangium sp.]